ncbi:LysE family translocator [Hasllibacter sp. MH4015]|uniref:LysE family translocator n=1 Tax=Hasllibacter sp. MH4015 TaxID=2854029 RepID=UPI001CD67815|nr:LysE family translocator [Hasllibacter sp. MH4015]
MDPLFAFVFVGLFSPGPNVILLTASGARFGFARTLPHVLGVALGVGITAGLTGFGIGALLAAAPGLTHLLKIVAAAWILWMAWTLWRSSAADAKDTDAPWGIGKAALFQWINPKVWAIAIAAASGFPGGLSPAGEALRLGATFSTINLGVCLFWSFAGSLLALLLTTPRAWTVFARIMATGLAASAIMVFL